MNHQNNLAKKKKTLPKEIGSVISIHRVDLNIGLYVQFFGFPILLLWVSGLICRARAVPWFALGAPFTFLQEVVKASSPTTLQRSSRKNKEEKVLFTRTLEAAYLARV